MKIKKRIILIMFMRKKNTIFVLLLLIIFQLATTQSGIQQNPESSGKGYTENIQSRNVIKIIIIPQS